MVMSEPVITEANFIDTGKTFGDGTTKATALYCNDCLKDPVRVNEPKTAIDRETLRTVNLADLPDSTVTQTETQTQTQTQIEP